MPATTISSDVGTNQGHARYQLGEALVELIWRDLGGQFPLEQVRQLALEIAAEYQDATVTAYIPILIRRQIRERLMPEHADTDNR